MADTPKDPLTKAYLDSLRQFPESIEGWDIQDDSEEESLEEQNEAKQDPLSLAFSKMRMS